METNLADNFKGATGHRWEPGESGNPDGRPKSTLTSLLERYVNADGEKEKKALVKELLTLAKTRQGRGQIPALMEIFNRLDGKVIDRRISINVTATTESIREAQDRLLEAQTRTNQLQEKYPKR